MEVVEVALGFQITLSLLRDSAGKPASAVMWTDDLVPKSPLNLLDRSSLFNNQPKGEIIHKQRATLR